ncbi:MAG TPA: hypothetical protein PK054_11755 [Anaerohalosphaeraceae bacterium]|nr:hypothetical protein [Anaerohalosphaeraceae bacterium]HOL90086.1 hypothetical protein [Anaerohalosphaeraceae bacterium]HPP57239.1 hypothetical protein [Anaerohalosphaeraceae bacterium]
MNIRNGFLLFFCGLSLSFGAAPQVFSINPHLFSKSDEPLEIAACADNQPNQVLLQWASSLEQGTEEMTWEPNGECWKACLSAKQTRGEEIRYQILAHYDGNTLVQSPEYIVSLYSETIPLVPKAMAVQAKILVQHKWNENPDAFSLLESPDGTVIGPAAIVCRKNQVHVLDTAKGRILTYDLHGRRQKQILLPTSSASDLVIDPNDNSFLVISQAEDRVHRLRPGRPIRTQPLHVRRQLAYPAQFRYDPSSETLMAKDGARQNRWAGVLRRNQNIFRQSGDISPTQSDVLAETAEGGILVKSPRYKSIYSVSFEQPVRCIEETLEDKNGVIWLLFTLEGDYRIRRLCRIDLEKQTAQTAQIDVWFSFEAARRMDLTDQGVVLLAGDNQEGRIILFEYQGELP